MAYATTAVAQQVVIDRCKQTSSDADRIACLEAALLGREMASVEESEAQVDPLSMELEAPPEVEQTPATMTLAAEAPIEAAPVGLGAEQVIARRQTKEERRDSVEELLDQKVASYGYVPYERLVVRLENGQVWRQTKGDTQRIRVDLKRNQTVDISEASMSGYKLRLNEIQRTIRAERIR